MCTLHCLFACEGCIISAGFINHKSPISQVTWVCGKSIVSPDLPVTGGSSVGMLARFVCYKSTPRHVGTSSMCQYSGRATLLLCVSHTWGLGKALEWDGGIKAKLAESVNVSMISLARSVRGISGLVACIKDAVSDFLPAIRLAFFLLFHMTKLSEHCKKDKTFWLSFYIPLPSLHNSLTAIRLLETDLQWLSYWNSRGREVHPPPHQKK